MRVLDEGQSVEGNLVDELNALMVRSMVDTALKTAAAVAVSSNLDAVSSDRIVDELWCGD
jgi:hypothetical protein